MAVPSLCTKASPCFSADGVNCEVPTHSAPWPDYRRGVFPSFATLISGCIPCIYSSSSVFFPLTLILNMGNFPQGTLAVSGGTFCCHNLVVDTTGSQPGGRCFSHLTDRDQACCRTPHRHRDSTPQLSERHGPQGIKEDNFKGKITRLRRSLLKYQHLMGRNFLGEK